MKENEEILNTKIDTNIDEFKAEASISINKTFYPLNSNKYPSSYNQPSADINKLPLLKSPNFHSHASQFTKNRSPMTLEGDTLLQLQKWWCANLVCLLPIYVNKQELTTIQETQSRKLRHH